MVLIVASIDFGTTYSGWAFSFEHDYKEQPTKVVSKNWHGGNFMSAKGPTCVLIEPDGKTFAEFGYEAENMYADLAADNKHKEWFYFKLFKMQLFDKKQIHSDLEIEDETGKRLPALTVFSMAIKYLKDDLKKNSEDKIASGSLENDIHWVLTVPAIWNESAKLFMRTAAKQAGINGQRLSLALEPEAASLYCRHIPVEKCHDTKKTGVTSFQPGSTYMVLDAGGGTVDITVHKVKDNGKLDELYKATGGPWGGTTVTNAYMDFLDKITGAKGVIAFLKEKHMEDYIEVFRDFEVKKRDICQDTKTKVNLRVPLNLVTLVKDVTKSEISKTIRNSMYQDDVSFSGDKIRVEPRILRSMFDKPISNIVKHVNGLFQKKDIGSCNTVLLVGGFSESKMLRNAIEIAYPEKRIITPQDAGLAVLKGAVIFGHDRDIIESRIARHTYGLKHWKIYDPKRHPKTRMEMKNGEQKVRGAFRRLVGVGQPVSCKDASNPEHFCPVEGETSFAIKVFASPKKDPVFVDEPDSFPIGEVIIDCNDKAGNVTGAAVSFLCGGTELEVRAVNNATGQQTTASFDLLD